MKTKKVMIGFKTDPEIKAKLEAIAYKEDRTISYIVNRIIAEGLKGYEDNAPPALSVRAGESRKKSE